MQTPALDSSRPPSRRSSQDDWELDDSPGLPGSEPRRRPPRPPIAAAAAVPDNDSESGDDHDEYTTDDDEGNGGGDGAESDSYAAARDDAEESASGDELRTLTQQMLCIDLPPLVEIESPAAMSAFEYTPLAPGTRWLRLADVGVVLAAPRTWRLLRGEGYFLGVPVVQYVMDNNTAQRESSAGARINAALTVRHFRGAFASALLAAAHGSPHGVARFFAQLHVIRASPPGLVSAAQFAEAESGRSNVVPEGADLSAILGTDSADGSRASIDGNDALRGLVSHADPARRPDVVGSWHQTFARSDVMNLAELAAVPHKVGHGAASAAPTAEGSPPLLQLQMDGSVRMHVPVALGPGALLRRAAAPHKRGSTGGSNVQPWPAGMPPHPEIPATSGPTRPVTLRASDRLHVYGLEYEMRHAPGGPNAAGSASQGGGMRYNLTLVLDPTADSVHEVAFECDANVWDAAWAHEIHDASRGVHSARLRALGLENVAARELLDAATVVGVVPAHPQPEHDIG